LFQDVLKRKLSMITRRILYVLLIAAGLFLAVEGCKKNEDNLTYHEQELYFINKAICDTMNIYYLWYKNIPSKVDFRQEPPNFFNSLKYRPQDRWSFITNKASFYSDFVGGSVYASHGIGVMSDDSNALRVALIFPNTTAYKSGVRRGWIIRKINGKEATIQNYHSLMGPQVPGNADTFLFQHDTLLETKILYNETFTSPTVIKYDTLRAGNALIGYLMFYEFRGSDSQAELDSAFAFFVQAGINELILDLRYNTGGFNSTAHYLVNLIAGKMFAGEIFVKYTFNDKLASLNESEKLTSLSNSLSLSGKRIYIVTTRETASSSELVINSLKPFFTVYTIGDTTHGKPVGMIVFDMKYYDYVIAPIAFSIYNKNNEGDYFQGIPPSFKAPDDIAHDFGDPAESCVKAAISHITSGSFFLKEMRTSPFTRQSCMSTDFPRKQKMGVLKVLDFE